jgi:hypothetical protein
MGNPVSAPFAIDAGDARLSVNPGPWGVAIHVSERWGQLTGVVQSQDTAITLTSEQATKVAAALILAAATAASYREVTA